MERYPRGMNTPRGSQSRGAHPAARSGGLFLGRQSTTISLCVCEMRPARKLR